MELSLSSRYLTFAVVIGDERKRDTDLIEFVDNSGGDFGVVEYVDDAVDDQAFGFQVTGRG